MAIIEAAFATSPDIEIAFYLHFLAFPVLFSIYHQLHEGPIFGSWTKLTTRAKFRSGLASGMT